VLSLFIIGHMGLFFYNKIGSIISIVDLPTIDIIEPFFARITSHKQNEKELTHCRSLLSIF
ncbi:hypothetical protein, partial [Streptococcus pneumoniae]|uniref:hypothetical protein n=1 Tax=Streptococcus pneumoniae TaxID=1313 RepID=UPI001E45ADA4